MKNLPRRGAYCFFSSVVLEELDAAGAPVEPELAELSVGCEALELEAPALGVLGVLLELDEAPALGVLGVVLELEDELESFLLMSTEVELEDDDGGVLEPAEDDDEDGLDGAGALMLPDEDDEPAEDLSAGRDAPGPLSGPRSQP